jgi:hypothetical protein
MKHRIEEMSIDRRMEDGKYFYFVVEKATRRTFGVKYADEEHAMRYVKYLCNFKKDWRFMNVERTWKIKEPEIAPVKEPVPVVVMEKETNADVAMTITKKPAVVRKTTTRKTIRKTEVNK